MRLGSRNVSTARCHVGPGVKLVNIKIETFISITNNNNNELAFLYLNRMHNKIKEPQNESGTK